MTSDLDTQLRGIAREIAKIAVCQFQIKNGILHADCNKNVDGFPAWSITVALSRPSGTFQGQPMRLVPEISTSGLVSDTYVTALKVVLDEFEKIEGYRP